MKKYLAVIFGTLFALEGAALAAENLDVLYGIANRPSYIKHYEADKEHNVLLNPYLQVATKGAHAVLDVKRPVYNFVITPEGGVALIEEAPHPYGRTYPKGFFRPEDKSQRKPGTTENYGHVSGTAGGPGRISGEIINDRKNNCWLVNNKSGRYSKRNIDRTPEQLLNAFVLMQETIDPGDQPWCKGAAYLLGYAPDYISEPLRKSPDMRYEDPETKKNAHILLVPGVKPPHFAIPQYQHISLDALPSGEAAGGQAKDAAKPESKSADKSGKGVPAPEKAAYNDDPS